MTPPCYTFPAAELTERVQLDVHGRQRKMLPGSSASTQRTSADAVHSASDGTDGGSGRGSRHQGIDIVRDCTLVSSMVQYSCSVMHPEMRDSPVRCWPMQRMFRRCQDRHGTFTVETTAWEGTEASRRGSVGSSVGSITTDATTEATAGRSPASSSFAVSTGAAPPKRPETLGVFG
ncbi:uncharacterized protein SPSK_02771 [Sporothrix schenckii 1099-18]|uniref:Uncharacterized protein n=1 Tax=Sporothrix schenckii 1099-18 TaxID=1397361 RepID=A0A0F2MAG6_SPOSC|nr:uncharacterized protein SPSK_02771 [Sporothrix schenckii 1099-18]KJR86688.1 hypothetical protein SPSK_02771 [Sporothrix schenckii 1099-18]